MLNKTVHIPKTIPTGMTPPTVLVKARYNVATEIIDYIEPTYILGGHRTSRFGREL